MLGLNLIDLLVLAVYLLGITILGSWAAKRVTTAASFFISDRKFGKFMMLFHAFGTGTHSDQAVSVAAKTFHVGASGIWYQWLWLFSTPFYWLLAPVFRRMRAVTTADFFNIRFGKSVGMLFALVGMLQLMINIGVMLKGSSAMISAVSSGTIAPFYAISIMTVLFVTYGLFGGLNAAIITDTVQGILTIVLSFLILPFALGMVGGISGLKDTINDPSLFEIVAPGEITAFYIFVIALNGLIGWVTQPHNMGMCAAGKTETESRIGLVTGMFTKRICTIAWVITGLCGIGMYMGNGNFDVDLIYGRMARDLLPQIAPGLIGLFIASLLAAVMSSCDSFMITSSALFTENIYKPFLAPGKSDRHYIQVGRIAAVVVVAGGMLFAFQMESVVHGLEIFWKIMAMMGVAFWAGFFWRKATPAAAWASTLVSFAVFLFTSNISIIGWDFNQVLAGRLPEFMLWEGKLYLPWQMILYLGAGFITIIVVSIFTKPMNKETLDRVYSCLRTPVNDEEPEVEPFTLPVGINAAPRSVIVNHPDFEIMRPGKISVIGFLLSWIGVGLLIASFFWILK
ncbi:MAG: sodium:solute symporter family protein [Fibrobacteria bacterium]|nr:sodium:solute symporter family protein [Fibrobacteria bacterium]